ncbi:hypothetical protein [Gracilibacillus salinarum]|uniref:Uncharacterized protein n=1 Tax=Gracilibacillus salinarum TaxID=2932255 RepID=A0ABY4GM72_9BACI|nr:hypothetical protein [Gracilibacillus salinarum]UOQ85329.1 hypothetical protein MUN87_22265 [Gracilibacillus salinarum]
MGHDIYGYNKAGQNIAYARFSMGNPNADLLYEFLHAQDFNGGVSGIGDISTFSRLELDNALKEYKVFDQKIKHLNEDTILGWDKKQIKEFIENCLAAAKKEGSIQVFFG